MKPKRNPSGVRRHSPAAIDRREKNAGGTHGIARVLSKLGVCSRAQAQRLVAEGRVRVDGRVVRDAEMRVDAENARIEIDGNRVGAAEKIYIAMNKPRGFVTTASDERGRSTVYDLLRENGVDTTWIAPVGRLDKASEGLLLFTNDSDWAARLTAPSSHLDKIYHVQIDALPDAALLRRLNAGVETEIGFMSAKRLSELRRGEKNAWLEVVLDEGKNRQIRRLLGAVGIDVLRLIRVAIGPLALGELAKGKTRRLTREEIRALG